MNHSSVLRRLGFSDTDAVVVINADDVGMCQSTLPAFFNLVDAGLVSSGSIMVSCPWFPEAARWCRRHPRVDVGIHLTLTSEWDGYRWGPISTCDPASGLLDAEGYFYRNQSMWENPDPQAIRVEMQAQVERALEAGIDLTHIDCHMFANLVPVVVDHYVALGFEQGVPVMMVRQPQWVEALSAQAISEWEEQGLPVFDHLREMYLNETAEGRIGQAQKMFDDLPPGLTYLLVHPALDTPELRAMTDDWRQRLADYETFMSSHLRDHVRRCGVHVIGWRPLREAMQAALRPAAGQAKG